MASTVTAQQIKVILHLSLWWIYKRCKQENQHWEGLGKEGERGDGEEQLLKTSDGVELPPNNLNLREKLKMFENGKFRLLGGKSK